MIPHFPRFKKLSLSDKSAIERITREFLPYSDFNFASMWSYNTQNAAQISKLNNNLVLKFSDYVSGQPFYTFIGKKSPVATVNKIIKYAQTHKVDSTLHLIPQDVVKKLQIKSRNSFVIKEDRSNHDYVLSIREIATLGGNKYRGKRNFVNRFLKQYPDHKVQMLDLKNKTTHKQILKLCKHWQTKTTQSKQDTENEFAAIKRILKHHAELNVISIAIYIKNKLCAFAIVEPTFHHYGILHFEKADTAYIGVFQYLKQLIALELQKHHCEFLNVEQDLNIEGLRKNKESWNPHHFLKKYRIAKV